MKEKIGFFDFKRFMWSSSTILQNINPNQTSASHSKKTKTFARTVIADSTKFLNWKSQKKIITYVMVREYASLNTGHTELKLLKISQQNVPLRGQ